jgi:hypothetical protein
LEDLSIDGDNIKTDLKETGNLDVDWTYLAQESLEHSNEPSVSIRGLGFLD